VTDASDLEVNKMKEETERTANARASADAATGDAPPVVLYAVTAMAAVGELGDDDNG
jgi:hypothetical protein